MQQLLQFADNPKVTDRQVFDVVADVAKAPLPADGKNFLRTRDRERPPGRAAGNRGAVPRAQERAERIVRRRGLQRVPDRRADSLGEVAGALEKRFGRKLNVTVQEDPSLIGGIRVVVGDEVLDTSVKARLEQMKVALTA